MARSTDAPPPAGPSHAARQPREQLEEAEQLRQQRKFDRAEAICYRLVRSHPGYVAALHTLGLVYLDKGDFERALDCLVRAAMLDPANWMTLTALSLAYLRLGASEMAAQTLDRALVIRPLDASIFTSLGEIHREEREHELAIEAYRRALALDPNMETAGTGLALCLSSIGQPSEAAGVLGEAYGRGIRSLRLLHIMTMLPKGTVPIDILGALDRIAVGLGAADASSGNTFLFARAAALDGAGRHKEAWETLVAANRPMAVQSQAELKAQITRRERSLSRLRVAPVVDHVPMGRGEPISLFILGPSRSGKTTLEQLVNSFDNVKAGGEILIVEKALRRTFQTAAIPASNRLEDLPAQLLPAFRDLYLEELARRAGSAQVFTNTLPAHIHNAALISRAIPNARFLLVKRGLEDTAWRIYLTKYFRGNAHAYDLKAIRDYLDWYNAMIDLTAEKLPGVTRIVSYDAAVSDPAAALREVAELCGLTLGEPPASTLANDSGCSGPYRELLLPR